jgi:hypothetical protein
MNSSKYTVGYIIHNAVSDSASKAAVVQPSYFGPPQARIRLIKLAEARRFFGGGSVLKERILLTRKKHLFFALIN